LYVSGALLGRECQYTTQKRACQHDFWIFSAEFFETLKIACFLSNPLDFLISIFAKVFCSPRHIFAICPLQIPLRLWYTIKDMGGAPLPLPTQGEYIHAK